jgi:hypothetical protein
VNWHPDLHHQYALDRQQRLLADAAATRLAGGVPARSRIAHLLRRRHDRPEAAPPRAGAARPAAERGC